MPDREAERLAFARTLLEAIAFAEGAATAYVRAVTGRDDLFVTFDKEQLMAPVERTIDEEENRALRRAAGGFDGYDTPIKEQGT